MGRAHAHAQPPGEYGGLATAPPGWGGTERGVPWARLPVERRARVWAAFIGVDPAAIVAGTAALAHDRDALMHLLRLVEGHRARLMVARQPTDSADDLLAKLTWELAALGRGAD